MLPINNQGTYIAVGVLLCNTRSFTPAPLYLPGVQGNFMSADTLGGGTVQGGTEGILDSPRNNSISAFLFGKQQQQTVKNIGFSIFSRKHFWGVVHKK